MVAKRFVAKRNGKHDEETTGVHVCHHEETMALHEVKQKSHNFLVPSLQSNDNAIGTRTL